MSLGHVNEVEACLLEARECYQRDDAFRPVSRGDNLIAPAACVDSDEVDNLQGAFSAIVDRDSFSKLTNFYVEHNLQHTLR